MMYWHRLCALMGGLLIAYVVVTGAGIELSDMRALLTHAPATDPDVLMMRQHIEGPPNYAIITPSDYTGEDLPANADYPLALSRAAALGRAAEPGADLRLVELRMVAGRPAARVQMGTLPLIFDLASGARLPSTALPVPAPNKVFSLRNGFKFFHKFTFWGRWATGINALVGLAICILMVTGLMQYAKLYKVRLKLDRPAPFWKAGNGWRNLHRWTAVGAGVFVLWIAVTGFILSLDNFGAFISIATSGKPSSIDPFTGDLSRPMHDAELPVMAQTTVSAFHHLKPNTGIKVIRLRYFVGYPQGVILSADKATTQLVFNAQTGKRMSMYEIGYPNLNFPSGWEWHQRLKRLHRGDFFGMPGRWMDTVGALALVYLSLSGLIMYTQLWLARRRAGRKSLVW
jgi:uncharacterized iron-regulated membrane protein